MGNPEPKDVVFEVMSLQYVCVGVCVKTTPVIDFDEIWYLGTNQGYFPFWIVNVGCIIKTHKITVKSDFCTNGSNYFD